MAISVFDIVGPVMVGPSSSHTLAAVRLGSFVRNFAHGKIKMCTITLFGSFAHTYKGHRTDIAIVGGLIGIAYDDETLRLALSKANEEQFPYKIQIGSTSAFNGNVASFDIIREDNKEFLIYGESTGGGQINIFQIDNMKVGITGEYPTLITIHLDKVGVIAKIATALAENDINIAYLKLYREDPNEKAILVAQTDQGVPSYVVDKINSISEVCDAIAIGPIQ